ncbi:MAG: hypothetical protein ACOX5R_12000 [bacterium]|jgi:hypothetical protein
MIDIIADILRIPGEALRQLMLVIPLWLVRILFLAYPTVLLIWVFLMKRSETHGHVHGRESEVDLRPYAAVALISQIIIYAVF